MVEAAGGLVVEATRAERGEAPLSEALPLDVSRHPAAASRVARDMVRRMATDVRELGEAQNRGRFPKLAGYPDAALNALAAELAAAKP